MCLNQGEYDDPGHLFCIEYADEEGCVIRRAYVFAHTTDEAYEREDDPLCSIMTERGNKIEAERGYDLRPDEYSDSCAYILHKQELEALREKYKAWLEKARENMDDLTRTLIQLEEVEV